MNEHFVSLAEKIKDAFRNTDEVTLNIPVTKEEAESCFYRDYEGTKDEFDQFLETEYKLEIENADFDDIHMTLICDAFSTEMWDGELDDEECEGEWE